MGHTPWHPSHSFTCILNWSRNIKILVYNMYYIHIICIICIICIIYMDLSIFKRVIPLWCWPGGCSSFRTSSLPSPSQRRSRFLCCCNPESYPSQRSSKQNKIFEQFWSQLGLKQKRIWFDLGVSIKAGTTGVVAAARTCNFHVCQKVLFGSGRTPSKH